MSTGSQDKVPSSSAIEAEAKGHFYRALNLIEQGNDPGAIAEYRRALELDPAFADALHGLSRALQDSGQLDEAIAVTRRLLELDPEDVLAHTSLSILYQHKGMIPEAEAESTKAKILGWKKELRGAKPLGK